jgi:hypothetical protein
MRRAHLTAAGRSQMPSRFSTKPSSRAVVCAFANFDWSVSEQALRLAAADPVLRLNRVILTTYVSNFCRSGPLIAEDCGFERRGADTAQLRLQCLEGVRSSCSVVYRTDEPARRPAGCQHA